MSTLQALRASHGSVVAAKEPWLAEVLGNIDLVGLRCWRIEALHPVAVATDSLGSFYDGDSYFVLSSVQRTRVDFRGRVNEVGGTVQAVHVWQGPSSSIDERAIAAIKAQELVRALRGLPTLTREESGCVRRMRVHGVFLRPLWRLARALVHNARIRFPMVPRPPPSHTRPLPPPCPPLQTRGPRVSSAL